ncbi:hypothetical protein [Paenibacillus sp. RC67]|uniref:response regulator transcription factor n=1 Tax=Paenibacillus sp. RC67 TaxID=3039392 RepID=UPI0024AD2A28|nr:hypothetical protein [Paenibacillus sp. RC67]
MSQINRVLLAEPSQEHRERIKNLLELDPLFEVVAETDCGRDAISLADSLKPEVALVAVENIPHDVEPLLSVMETAVIRNLCRGFNIEEIADRLVIPGYTEKLILNDILFKLKLKSRTELVTYASDKGISMSKVSSKKRNNFRPY